MNGQQGKTGYPEIKWGSSLRRVGNGLRNRRTRVSFARGPGGLEDGLVAALLHFDGDRIGGRDKIVVLRGTFHSDLVQPLLRPLSSPLKPF